MSYKRLGNYIRQVNIRNKDLETETLLGVSITKKLIPSIANTIGTDMSNYKIIKRRQFAYGTVTSRNGDKISIALSDQYDKALVSQIYIVFEVINTDELLPEYLMMWFSRPEFDRYARFHSHGSTRETFDWEDMCEVELPIPSIEEQNEIVAQYQSVENKIKVNEQICEKLEATAQALYKHWFVDFEFPDENGKPYKSSGGKMIWNEELGKVIPEDWEVKNMQDITTNIFSGGTPSTENDSFWNGKYYWLSSGETGNKFITQTEKKITIEGIKGSSTKLSKKHSTVVATAGQGKTRGQSALLLKDVYINQSVICIQPKKDIFSLFIFININSRYEELRNISDAQSIRGSINSNDIKNLRLLVPVEIYLELFYSNVQSFFKIIEFKKQQNEQLSQLQNLLLSQLTIEKKVENYCK